MLLIVKRAYKRNLRRKLRLYVFRADKRGQALYICRKGQVVYGGNPCIVKGEISGSVEEKHIITGINQGTGIKRYQRAVINVSDIFYSIFLAAAR